MYALGEVPSTPWLYPEEREAVVAGLLEHGLLKFDNARSLPLKSGGKTDVYINLRDARDAPATIELLADLFSIPLRRLGIKRFVEVPDSVSCFAGPLAMKTGIPYLTIREDSKANRVADARVIGHPAKFESVCIIDDVITNGESKIVPYQKCVDLNLNVQALVVLVDRQQGWKKHLTAAGVDLPVWPGMTLHDVRRQLIQHEAMERCDPAKEKANPIIVALDGKSWEEILPLVDQLRTTGCIFKVNDLLFNQGIERLLPELSVYGRVMADLKCHDIKNTVENICARVRMSECEPWAITVHASGGFEMIKAAVQALQLSGKWHTKILAVTVLTSLDQKTCEEIYVRQPLEQVLRLAEIAHAAGAHGLVCSPQEVKELRNRYPDMILVSPGIRSPGKDTQDQQRVDTPEAAIANGSNHLVMGRQILQAEDPVAEVYRVLRDELHISAFS